MTDRPQMIVVGGPNGAGKTTLSNQLIRTFGFPYIGADKIAADICPEAPESVAFEAGRGFMNRIDTQIEARESFIVESTLSGKSFAKTIRRARGLEFAVDSTFVFVDSPLVSVSRVADRVRRGGHHVPENDVIRRFGRSLANFWRLYRPLSDRWSIVYNDAGGRIEVARSKNNAFDVSDSQLFDLFKQLGGLADDDC